MRLEKIQPETLVRKKGAVVEEVAAEGKASMAEAEGAEGEGAAEEAEEVGVVSKTHPDPSL